MEIEPAGEPEKVWIAEVDRILRRDWCIGVVDAGLSEDELRRYWQAGDAAAEFVEWFADKYDLIRFDGADFFQRRRISP